MLIIAMLLDKGRRHLVHRRTSFATPIALGAIRTDAQRRYAERITNAWKT
jgi:hypothetical protein